MWPAPRVARVSSSRSDESRSMVPTMTCFPRRDEGSRTRTVPYRWIATLFRPYLVSSRAVRTPLSAGLFAVLRACFLLHPRLIPTRCCTPWYARSKHGRGRGGGEG